MVYFPFLTLSINQFGFRVFKARNKIIANAVTQPISIFLVTSHVSFKIVSLYLVLKSIIKKKGFSPDPHSRKKYTLY